MDFLVDPTNVIKYDRTDAELELWWLFGLVVAGKTAKTQARLLCEFLYSLPEAKPDTPFERIALALSHGDSFLMQKIKDSRLGQYNRLFTAMVQSLTVDLRSGTVDDFEAIHGVGPKTARMFVMMSRPNMRHAALDTHVLKYLASRGHDVPKSTPSSGKTYRKWEEQFLQYADQSLMTVAEFDLNIWKSYART